MPAIHPPRRVNVNADMMQPSLRIAGYDPAEPISLQVQRCVYAYGELVLRAGIEVDPLLDAREWNLIADVLGGCAELSLHVGASVPASLLLHAQVEDGRRLDRIGDKWFGEEGNARIVSLLGKLKGLSELQCHAVLAAVRFHWMQETPPENWWKVGHRLPERK